MGNKPSTSPSTHPVRVPQNTQSRRNSEYRSRVIEAPNPDGRRWSVVTTTQRSMSIKPKRLSPRHRNLIIKSWNKTNKLKVAKDTFIELFKISDEIRSKFAFGDITMKRLRFDERFIAHCERFVSALNHVIGHLDEIGAVIESAETLGRKHATMVDALKHEHWQMFIDTLIDRIMENEGRQMIAGGEVHMAWKMLGQLLVFHMRLGYDREALKIARNNRSLAANEQRINKNYLYLPDRDVQYA
uniref:Globin family profile domain-containing protein n=1 Tax=Ascaris lumbricoides TaxID=6252 RepID=A0A9J2PML7_ASCLU